MKFFKNSIKISALALVLATSACDKFTEFGDTNLSPNSPAQPSTSSLLTGALTSYSFGIGATSGSANAMAPNMYVQHFSDITYIEESRYKTVFWNYAGFYTGPLNNLATIIKLNTDATTKSTAEANGSNANQIAVARILKAYLFLHITDRWGDIPYSQALKGATNFTPAFDKQQDIYTDLFKELKEAAGQFDAGKAVVGDVLLGGSAAKWKKFAASTRAIMALRLSKIDPAKGKSEFASAIADGVLASNADNVTYKYLKDANYENPLYNNYITTNRKDFAVSNVFVGYLTKTTDPRLAAYADKATATGTYAGVPYGVFPPTWKAQDVSLGSTALRPQDGGVNIITYAQMLFSQAEAIKLGWITGDAKKMYEDAIKASMQQWGVYTDAAYAAYIAQTDVAYTDAKALELIGTQKWVALFYQGFEAWAEWRRTGFPALTPAAKPLNTSGKIPRRMAYPTTETTLNAKNYADVVARQGADNQETRMWWDK
jgi:hypothetical protein